MENEINQILLLCAKSNLSDDEIETTKRIFQKGDLSVNYCDGLFITESIANDNVMMLDILLNNSVDGKFDDIGGKISHAVLEKSYNALVFLLKKSNTQLTDYKHICFTGCYDDALDFINFNSQISQLKSAIRELEQEKEKHDELVRLRKCEALVNEQFKEEYKKRFKPKRGEYVPDIWEIRNDPPLKEDDEEFYFFWEDYKRKHPEHIKQFCSHATVE